MLLLDTLHCDTCYVLHCCDVMNTQSYVIKQLCGKCISSKW